MSLREILTLNADILDSYAKGLWAELDLDALYHNMVVAAESMRLAAKELR